MPPMRKRQTYKVVTTVSPTTGKKSIGTGKACAGGKKKTGKGS